MIAPRIAARTAPRIDRRRLMLNGAAGLGTALLAPLAAGAPAMARAQDYRLNPSEIADGVWLIEGARESFGPGNGGAICNIVMLASDAGAVVIDTGGTARHGAALRAFADQRLGGVAASINTHHHPDHWFGNQAFSDAPIHALPASAGLQAEQAQPLAEGLYRILGPWMSGTAPSPATHEARPGLMRIGGRALDLMALSGHSQADLALMDRATGTLIAGDLLFLDRAPSFPDARPQEWRDALARLAQLPSALIVPGHGPAARDSRAFVQTRAYLDAFEARLSRASGLGLAPAEALAAGPAPDFAELGANPEEYQRAVIQRWRDYETEALTPIGGRT